MNLLLPLLTGLALAYGNGANDTFKGVATLYGCGTAGYRRALAWALVGTALGGVVAVWTAGALVHAFQGDGLVRLPAGAMTMFMAAVGFGAAVTVLLATWMGMPTSTTHALAGALVGAALLVSSEGLRWSRVVAGFALPLLISPVLAMGLTYMLDQIARFTAQRLGWSRETCLCLTEDVPVAVATRAEESAVLSGPVPHGWVAHRDDCRDRSTGNVPGVVWGRIQDRLHFASAGAVSFSRAVNDTPKMAALLLVVPSFHAPAALGMVVVAMVLGGFLHARRVAETLSHRVTRIEPGPGLVANLVTAVLVFLASPLGLPASTTHVAVGSLYGLGAARGRVNGRVAAWITATWLVTVPLGALLGATAFWVLGRVQ